MGIPNKTGKKTPPASAVDPVVSLVYEDRLCPNCSSYSTKLTRGKGCDYYDTEEREKCVNGIIKSTYLV
jgi:hypothetical protein